MLDVCADVWPDVRPSVQSPSSLCLITILPQEIVRLVKALLPGAEAWRISVTARRWRLSEGSWWRLRECHDVAALKRFALSRYELRAQPALAQSSCARIVVTAAHRGVGLTSLCQRWTTCDEVSSITYGSTHRRHEMSLLSAYVGERGDAFTGRLEIIDKRCTAQMTPFARSLYTTKPTSVAIVVDLTVPAAFDGVSQLVESLKCIFRDPSPLLIPMLLIGNKADSPARVISRRKAADFATQHGLIFIETDATTGHGTKVSLLYAYAAIHSQGELRVRPNLESTS